MKKIKLIIEISEEMLNNPNAFPEYMFKKSILNGTLLQAEYEEIKAEIESEKDKLKMKNFNVITGIEVGIDILDKRIKELHNEENKTDN